MTGKKNKHLFLAKRPEYLHVFVTTCVTLASWKLYKIEG